MSVTECDKYLGAWRLFYTLAAMAGLQEDSVSAKEAKEDELQS